MAKLYGSRLKKPIDLDQDFLSLLPSMSLTGKPVLEFSVLPVFTLVNVKAPVVATTNWWWLISALVVA